MFKKKLIIILTVVFLIGMPSYLTAEIVSLRKSIENLHSRYPNLTDEEIATVETVKRAQKSVVSVVIKKEVFGAGEQIIDLGNGFEMIVPGAPQSKGKQVVGQGSGFVIREDGLIATNKHVVTEENAEYQVVFAGGKTLEAKVVATDPFNDVALLKVEKMPKSAAALVLGSSKNLIVGQTVIAIGNALGELQNSVTKGVVSALNRSIYASDEVGGQTEKLVKIIQTDAAINPGNSGGPLFNTSGEVVGINTAVNRGAENIGFAIPIDDLKFALKSYGEKGAILRPLLGIRYAMLDEESKQKLGLKYSKGAILMKGDAEEPAVTPGSPAKKAGLAEGDIILKINNVTVDGDRDPASIIRDIAPGETVKLRVWKKSAQKEQIISVKLAEAK